MTRIKVTSVQPKKQQKQVPKIIICWSLRRLGTKLDPTKRGLQPKMIQGDNFVVKLTKIETKERGLNLKNWLVRAKKCLLRKPNGSKPLRNLTTRQRNQIGTTLRNKMLRTSSLEDSRPLKNFVGRKLLKLPITQKTLVVWPLTCQLQSSKQLQISF